MGIRRGGLTFTRYTVSGKPPKDLRQHYSRAVRAHVLTPLLPDDEAMETSGWCTLERPFDLDLNPTKLFEGAVLLVGFRVDRYRIPAALIRAQLEDEERALLEKTGKPRLSRTERTELKQKLKLRLRKKATPSTRAFDVYWDLDGGTVLFFSHSARIKEAFTALFDKTFGLPLSEDSPFIAAKRARLSRTLERRLGAVEPTSLITARRDRAAPGGAASDGGTPESGAASRSDADTEDDRDLVDRIETTRFLGSEFLLWLWLRTELVGSEIPLPEFSKVEVWLEDQLALCSPIDPKESVVIRGMAPADGAEAREGLRAQKLPVSGRVVVRTHEGDFSFVLRAPLFALGSAKVPVVITDEDGDAFADRVDRVEQLLSLLDCLFARFLNDRLGPIWAESWEPAITAWIDERAPRPAHLQKIRGATERGKRRRTG